MYAGVEARGFIFGPPIALAIGAKFVPLRKPGKLPGTISNIHTYHFSDKNVHFDGIEKVLLKDTIDCDVKKGRVISEEYELEYGRDCLEMSVEAVKSEERALIIDDLVATGGTLSASINLLGK